jgi:glutamyl-tRNA synthetase
MKPTSDYVVPIRVRFAPSPTGHLHIGGLRTALFNWLFAKHNGGIFLVRIEDTDRDRSTQEYTDSILTSLLWVGIVPDEPIVVQSARLSEHAILAQKLLVEGKAYRCVCSQEEVLHRSHARGEHAEQVRYDGLCRAKNIADTVRHVIRFKIPDETIEFSFDDIIRGSVKVPRDQLDDFIIVRSDGLPVYNFVVVADDAHMKISHVIRGEDHIINTPKQILLYKALGYEVPLFAHIPLVLGPSGQKLSKREAATAVIDYKKEGFFPEALVNYLVRLGWSHGDQELFTRQELINYFDLANVSKAGAIFDAEKLLWLNSIYMRAMSDQMLGEHVCAVRDLTQYPETLILSLIPLYKERTRTLKELGDAMYQVLQGPSEYHDVDLQPLKTQETVAMLQRLIDRLEKIDTWEIESITAAIKQYAKETGVKFGDLVHVIRLALTGKSSGPGACTLAVLLGKEIVLRRLVRLYDMLDRMCVMGL